MECEFGFFWKKGYQKTMTWIVTTFHRQNIAGASKLSMWGAISQPWLKYNDEKNPSAVDLAFVNGKIRSFLLPSFGLAYHGLTLFKSAMFCDKTLLLSTSLFWAFLFPIEYEFRLPVVIGTTTPYRNMQIMWK